MNPQFNRETLREDLRRHGIEYVFLGEELGARTNDPACYRDGKVQYDLLSQTTLFRRGLERVRMGSEKLRIALMCAEKDPLQCHRTILVARNLVAEGVPVVHILSSGEIESQEQSEERLLNFLKISSSDLYRSRDEIIREAYRIQGDAIAYSTEQLSEQQADSLALDSGTSGMKIFTIGFTKTTAENFFSRLKKSGAKKIVDVRLNNKSQLAGFAKRDDLSYFVETICGMRYQHMPQLAPTQDIFDAYKKRKRPWSEYETKFLDLMARRRIEEIDREQLDGGCLLCSEDKPHHCHRRLVVEYLRDKWGDFQVEHL